MDESITEATRDWHDWAAQAFRFWLTHSNYNFLDKDSRTGGELNSRHRMPALCELALDGTAVGIGLNAPAGFAAAVIAELSVRTGLPLREASDHFEAQGARDAAAFLSAALRNYALSLVKIANDRRKAATGGHSRQYRPS